MKKLILAAFSFFVSAMLCSCAGEKAPSSESGQTDMPFLPEGESASWKAEGFAAPGEIQEGQALWSGEYRAWEKESGVSAGGKNLIYLDEGASGELFWRFSAEESEEGVSAAERKYAVEIYDTAGGEWAVRQFTQADLGLESPEGSLIDMDCLDKEHFVFRWVDFEKDADGMYRQSADCMVYTNLAGENRAVEMGRAFQEKGIVPEPEAAERHSLYGFDWWCDGRGCICAGRWDNGSYAFCLFDADGNFLMESRAGTGQGPLSPLRTEDGELIFSIYDDSGKCYDFQWADTEKAAFVPLAKMAASLPCISKLYGMREDEIYYESSDSIAGRAIVSWNVKSGEQKRVFDIQKAGISGYTILLALPQGRLPVLGLMKYGQGVRRAWLSALSEQEPAQKEEAVQVALLVPWEKGAECAVMASTENPNLHFAVEDALTQEARDRIFAEMTQGKGPELLFVSREDMYLLAEKGLLTDMGGLLDEGQREQILPGALELGTVDGTLCGLPYAVCAYTLMASADTWKEDTWRLEDIIGLMEAGELEGVIYSGMSGRYEAPLMTVLDLVMYSFEDSFLIDWENRECHFDDERFIRLLELTKTDVSGVMPEGNALLKEGKGIVQGWFAYEAGFLDFYGSMEKEGGRIVGYPTEGSCGSYLGEVGGMLVVNANAADREAVICFLETLLGAEMKQKMTGNSLSILGLEPEACLVEDESGVLRFFGGKEVPVYEDGTTALHRGADFLESCTAMPRKYYQINSILSEELMAMYSENKPARTTAEIINSRVQLYLDEGN